MRRILRWPFPSAAEKLQAAAPRAAEAAGQAAALGALEARLRWNRVNAAPLDIRVGNFVFGCTSMYSILLLDTVLFRGSDSNMASILPCAKLPSWQKNGSWVSSAASHFETCLYTIMLRESISKAT